MKDQTKRELLTYMVLLTMTGLPALVSPWLGILGFVAFALSAKTLDNCMDNKYPGTK